MANKCSISKHCWLKNRASIFFIIIYLTDVSTYSFLKPQYLIYYFMEKLTEDFLSIKCSTFASWASSYLFLLMVTIIVHPDLFY
jgi:hypothetical protein